MARSSRATARSSVSGVESSNIDLPGAAQNLPGTGIELRSPATTHRSTSHPSNRKLPFQSSTQRPFRYRPIPGKGRVRAVAAPPSVRFFTRPSCGRSLPRCCPDRPELWEGALGVLPGSSGVLPGRSRTFPVSSRLLPAPSCTLYFFYRRPGLGLNGTRVTSSFDCRWRNQ